MKKKKAFSGRTKALMIVVSVLAFLAVCILGVEFWLKNEIRAAIEKEAAALTGGRATVGIGRISVSLPARSVTVRNIRLRSQNDDSHQRGFTVVSIDAGIEKVSVRGIGYKKKNGKPALSAGSITITAPYATFVTKGPSAKDKDKSDEKEKRSLQQAITSKLNSIEVGDIRITGVKLDYVAWKGDDDGTRIGIENGNLEVEGFMIDSLPMAAGKIFFSDDITLSADRLSYAYDAGDFTLQADTVSLKAAEGSFTLRSAALIPKYPRDGFVQKSIKRTDWTEFSLKELKCTGVDFAGVAGGKPLAIDSLSFAAGHVASYKNRQMWQEPRIKPMLYQTIQNLPIGIDIRNMAFAGLDIAYYELAANGDTPGIVVFTEGSGTARNITNIAEDHDRFMTIDMGANLMDNGRLQAEFLFPVSKQDDYWEVSGKLGKMDPASLNRAIEPLAGIKVKTGAIHSVDFSVTATLEKSHVALTMLYDDLSIAFMKKGEEKERKLMTFIADRMILRRSNPGDNGKVRPGEGDFTRDPYKSMYNFMWKSLFQGIKSTVL